jgi:uncharacterized protein YxeA
MEEFNKNIKTIVISIIIVILIIILIIVLYFTGILTHSVSSFVVDTKSNPKLGNSMPDIPTIDIKKYQHGGVLSRA